MEFRITKVSFTSMPLATGMLGFARITLNDTLELRNIGVYSRKGGGVNCLYPARKLRNGQLDFYFMSSDPVFKKEIEQAIRDELGRISLFDFEAKENGTD